MIIKTVQTHVIGPESLWVDDILGYGQGPAFPERRVYLIEHRPQDDPRWLAVAEARKRGHNWPNEGHPLDGVTQARLRKTTPEPEA